MEKIVLSLEEINFFKTYELKKAKGEIGKYKSFEIILLEDGYKILEKIKNQIHYSISYNKPFNLNLSMVDFILNPTLESTIIRKLRNCKVLTGTSVNKIEADSALKDFEKFIYKYQVIFKNEFYPEIKTELDIIRESTKAKKKLEGYSKLNVIKEEGNTKQRREIIPTEVKNQVWNRDGGKCVECGSNEKLEFDHIIPFSKGGSNTYRNLQLLCEKCNKKKSNKIG